MEFGVITTRGIDIGKGQNIQNDIRYTSNSTVSTGEYCEYIHVRDTVHQNTDTNTTYPLSVLALNVHLPLHTKIGTYPQFMHPRPLHTPLHNVQYTLTASR